ncbi:MAG: SUF system NifU family Fe-S cluster assembly protein [Nanoarchaeota archaeon]
MHEPEDSPGERMYREHILDHYNHPHNFGRMQNPDAGATVLNPLCGDEITIQLKIDKKKRIRDIKFQGVGCAISQAAISMITDFVKGKAIIEVKRLLRKEKVLELLGIQVSPVRLKCALLSLDALEASIKKYESGKRTA